MDYTNAVVIIKGTAPYSQSFKHAELKLEEENADAYDQRTWRSKMRTDIDPETGRNTMVIPGMAFQRSISAGAKFSMKKIPNQGKSTWTKRFEAGLSVTTPGYMGIDPDTVSPIVISANSDGVRGSGKRVPRWLPQIPPGWTAKFQVLVLDPLITQDVFEDMLGYAGSFVGVGQFRPEKGGTNGRFILGAIEWVDNREFVQPVKRAA